MNQTENSDYLLIKADLIEQAAKGDHIVVELLNKSFPVKNHFFEIKYNQIVFHLYALDLDKFKQKLQNTIADVKARYPVHENAYDEILGKIESIGSYGIKYRKRIYIRYKDERKVRNRQEKVIRRKLYFYTEGNTFSILNAELPKEFENRIICADSEEVLKKLPDNCVDLVFTSPPYNFGLGYDTGEDGLHWEHYFKKLFAVFDECIRVLKYGGRIIVNVQPLFSDYIPSHQIIANHFMEKKLIWKGEILWEKNNYNCKYTAWGSWKSPSSPYLKYTWEFLEIFAKGDLVKKGSDDTIDITSDEFKKWVVARWSIAPERNMKKYDHPAMFPEELVERALKLFSFQNDVILDPFNGVGTTTVVAKRTKRRYIGIDVSEEYCKKSELRLKGVLESYISL
jgi:DNA modification methylase